MWSEYAGQTPVAGSVSSSVAGDQSREYLEGEDAMKLQASKERMLKPHGLPHLRTVRQQKGLSLGQLADMTGLRRETITHLENGRIDPLPYQVRLLAYVLKVRQLDLVS